MGGISKANGGVQTLEEDVVVHGVERCGEVQKDEEGWRPESDDIRRSFVTLTSAVSVGTRTGSAQRDCFVQGGPRVGRPVFSSTLDRNLATGCSL